MPTRRERRRPWMPTGRTCSSGRSTTTVSAGTNQEVCGLATTLAGNSPSVGTGTWTKMSGPGGVVFSNTNANSPGATATVDAYGTYVFKWTIHNDGVCGHESGSLRPGDDAGGQQSECGHRHVDEDERSGRGGLQQHECELAGS